MIEPQQSNVNNGKHSEFDIVNEISRHNKFKGLLKRRWTKVFQENLFKYFDYLYTMAPSHRVSVIIFRNIFLVQMFFVALQPFNLQLWDYNSLIGQIANIFSAFALISPAKITFESHVIVETVVYSLVLLFVVVFFSGMYVFMKRSKIPYFFVSQLTLFLNVLLPYVMNVIAGYIGRDLAAVLSQKGSDMTLFHLIDGVVILTVFIYLQSLFVTTSLSFRPQVINMMYSNKCQFFLICNVLKTMMIVYGGASSSSSSLYVSLASVIPVICNVYIAFIDHIWVNMDFCISLRSVLVTSTILSVAMPLLEMNQMKANEIVIVASLISLFLQTVVYTAKNLNRTTKSIIELENNATDPAYFENLTEKQLLDLVLIGFSYGNRMCHTWKIFDHIFPILVNNRELIILYSKFASIYSEESKTLRDAATRLFAIKTHCIEVKHLLFQVHSLLQQRERGLSRQLKKSISKVQEKSERCRGQIRYIWECVIRGSINEVEGLTADLRTKEEEVTREFNQLCLVYPNNPYVANAYAQFLAEIACRQNEALEYFRVYRQLRSGSRTRKERSYFFAVSEIPTLPSEEQHSEITRKETPAIQDKEQSVASFVIGQSFDPQDVVEQAESKKRYLETMIDAVRLPALQFAPYLIAFVACIMLQAISIPFLFTFVNRLDTNYDVMCVLSTTAQLKAKSMDLSALSLQYALSASGMIPTLNESFNTITQNDTLIERPAYWESDSLALQNCAKEFRLLMEELNTQISSIASIGGFDEAIQYMFKNTLELTLYGSNYSYRTIHLSFQNLLVYLSSGAVDILSTSTVDPIKYVSFGTLTKHCVHFLKLFDVFYNTIKDGLGILLQTTGTHAYAWLIISMVFSIVTGFSVVSYISYRLVTEKMVIFNSFKALPKSAVSAIVQMLNSQSGKQASEESQKHVSSAQEENAIRVLSTSAANESAVLSQFWSVSFPITICIIASVLIFVTLYFLPITTNEMLAGIAPLYISSTNVHTSIAVTSNLQLYLALQSNPSYNSSFIDNTTEFYWSSIEQLMNIPQHFHLLRSGGEDESGVSAANSDLISLLSSTTCDENSISLKYIDSFSCISYETSAIMVQSLLIDTVLKYDEGLLQANDIAFPYVSYWLHESNSKWLDPAFRNINATIYSMISDGKINLVTTVSIWLSIVFVIGVFFVMTFRSLGENAQWSLRLFLFCDPNIVLNSKVILKILSNDFNNDDNKDSTDMVERSGFYETVVSHLLDAVVFMSNDLVIRSTNSAIENVLGLKPQDVLGKSLRDILRPPKGHESSLLAFYAALDGAMNSLRAPNIECEAEVLRNNDSVTLQFDLTAVSAGGEVQTTPTNAEGLAILTLSMKDLTSTVASRRLLQEEHDKGEHLLSMILPPIIVQKLQRGEKNISFSVQSSSILFIDIVSFTPWCGSLPADTVMSTLNKLFAMYDKLLAKYPALTKIKCIGDCYMAAGGLFDDVHQPAVHTKQTISFCLDTILSMELFNIEHGTNLRIRVGVNCGGPIVAGVLGIDKPTFDILGPAISLAAAMEHHGIPMSVHIPQHVYELVYSENFRFKERGEIELKGRSYNTYLVTGYQEKD